MCTGLYKALCDSSSFRSVWWCTVPQGESDQLPAAQPRGDRRLLLSDWKPLHGASSLGWEWTHASRQTPRNTSSSHVYRLFQSSFALIHRKIDNQLWDRSRFSPAEDSSVLLQISLVLIPQYPRHLSCVYSMFIIRCWEAQHRRCYIW